jgi:hypothetical protein
MYQKSTQKRQSRERHDKQGRYSCKGKIIIWDEGIRNKCVMDHFIIFEVKENRKEK